MVNRICEDIAGYELWSTSGSSKRMPDSAHEVPRVGALAQLNSHFDVGKVYSNPLSAGPKCGKRCSTITLVVRNMGTGSLLHSHSVCVLQKKDYPIVTDMNPLTVASKASITHVQSRRG